MYIFLFFMYNSYVQKIKGVYKMKSIKSFKYVNENNFNIFLNEYGYSIADVAGFSLNKRKQYRGNILKIYIVYFNDGEYAYFKVVAFESYNEYRQSYLGFNGDKLLSWWENAHIRMYK